MVVWATWLRVDFPSYLLINGMLADVIGLAVAFIPEGLPLALALTLLIIVRRLLRRHNVLAKRLPIVETLGCVNILLSDKTG